MTLLISSLLLFMQVTNFQYPEFASSETVYLSKKSAVRFYSDAPLEDIEATSTKLRGVMTMETGKLLFVIPMTSFMFEKQLMQKHFNEQYLESDKYPEASFDGKFKESPIEVKGSKVIPYEGLMTIHGVSRYITAKAELERDGNIIRGHSTISIRLEDYKIKIPRMVIKNIAEVVEVTISVEFIPELNP
jgi:polyisoprenoid-binding protein YceI